MRLVRNALGSRGLTPPEKAELLGLYADAAGFRPRVPLSAAEIAERLRPLVAAQIEAELTATRSWPLQRGALRGVFTRALVSLWADLTDAAPPLQCATAGCSGTLPPTRNRHYCETCQADRRRDAVRRSRARPPKA